MNINRKFKPNTTICPIGVLRGCRQMVLMLVLLLLYLFIMLGMVKMEGLTEIEININEMTMFLDQTMV